MGIPLFILAVSLMFSGVHGISQSMSCSTVNGKTICNKETNQGNTAMSSSSSWSGPGSSSQQTYAGAGDPNGQWQSSGQSVNSGNPPPQGSNGPAEMVASFMNNGFGGGAFAGAGAFPFNFGRR